MKQLHGVNVQDLIQKIENHPNRHALQCNLQQRQSFNPFSKKSKDMIREVGNIELCELLDVEPKAQCKVCHVGIVYCTCGHFLRDGTEENKKFVKYTLHLLSIPNNHTKKGRPHGHRYGKKPGDHEYFTANSLKKKCKKRNFLGIHDRFIRDARSLQKSVIGLFTCGMSLTTNLVQKLQRQNSVTTQSTVTDGRFKEYTSYYRKLATKTVYLQRE